MESIELTAAQLPTYNKMMGFILEIDKEMLVSVESDNASAINNALNERIALLAYSPLIMELATIIFDHVSGICANEIMSDKNLLDAKQAVQRMYIQGRMAKWNGMFVRAERTIKDLAKSIDGLITMLSYAKSVNNAPN